MNEEYMCNYCSQGKVRPLQFNLSEAVYICTNPECDTYLQECPAECVTLRPLAESNALEKYESDCCSSDSNHTASRVSGSSSPVHSHTSSVDREVELYLKPSLHSYPRTPRTNEEEYPLHHNPSLDYYEDVNSIREMTQSKVIGGTNELKSPFDSNFDNELMEMLNCNGGIKDSSLEKTMLDHLLDSCLQQHKQPAISPSKFTFSPIKDTSSVFIPSRESAFTVVSRKCEGFEDFSIGENTACALDKSLPTRNSQPFNDLDDPQFLSPRSEDSGFNEEHTRIRSINWPMPYTNNGLYSLRKNKYKHRLSFSELHSYLELNISSSEKSTLQSSNLTSFQNANTTQSRERPIDQNSSYYGEGNAKTAKDELDEILKLADGLNSGSELQDQKAETISSNCSLKDDALIKEIFNDSLPERSVNRSGENFEVTDKENNNPDNPSNGALAALSTPSSSLAATELSEKKLEPNSLFAQKLEDDFSISYSPLSTAESVLCLCKPERNRLKEVHSSPRVNTSTCGNLRSTSSLKDGAMSIDPWSVPEVYLDELNIEVVLGSERSGHSKIKSEKVNCFAPEADTQEDNDELLPQKISSDSVFNSWAVKGSVQFSSSESDSDFVGDSMTSRSVYSPPLQQRVNIFKPVTLHPEILNLEECSSEHNLGSGSKNESFRLSVGYEFPSRCLSSQTSDGAKEQSYFDSIVSSFEFDDTFLYTKKGDKNSEESKIENYVSKDFLEEFFPQESRILSDLHAFKSHFQKPNSDKAMDANMDNEAGILPLNEDDVFGENESLAPALTVTYLQETRDKSFQNYWQMLLRRLNSNLRKITCQRNVSTNSINPKSTLFLQKLNNFGNMKRSPEHFSWPSEDVEDETRFSDFNEEDWSPTPLKDVPSEKKSHFPFDGLSWSVKQYLCKTKETDLLSNTELEHNKKLNSATFGNSCNASWMVSLPERHDEVKNMRKRRAVIEGNYAAKRMCSSLSSNPSEGEVIKHLKDTGWVVDPCSPSINYQLPLHSASTTEIPPALKSKYGNCSVVVWTMTDENVSRDATEAATTKVVNKSKVDCDIKNAKYLYLVKPRLKGITLGKTSAAEKRKSTLLKASFKAQILGSEDVHFYLKPRNVSHVTETGKERCKAEDGGHCPANSTLRRKVKCSRKNTGGGDVSPSTSDRSYDIVPLRTEDPYRMNAERALTDLIKNSSQPPSFFCVSQGGKTYIYQRKDV